LGAAGKLPANASFVYASLDQKNWPGTQVAALPIGGMPMTDKQKGSDTEQTTQPPAAQQPGAKGTRRNDNDALDKNGHVKPEKLADNQKKLNVGSDHKTPDMKKGHRGTFP
jgi:hypothetical protein